MLTLEHAATHNRCQLEWISNILFTTVAMTTAALIIQQLAENFWEVN